MSYKKWSRDFSRQKELQESIAQSLESSLLAKSRSAFDSEVNELAFRHKQ